MHPSHGRYLEIHMITNFKLRWPSSLVRISFLMTLSYLQMALNNIDLFSSFFDKIRPKISTVTYFNPVKWCSTFSSIQSFKGCHMNAFLIAIVVRNSAKFKHSFHFSGKKWHKLSTYPQVPDLPFLFGCQFADDKLNFGED